MGSFVDISEGRVALDDMHNQIDATITYTRTYADELRITLGNALEDLKNLVGTYDPSIDDIDTSIAPIDRPSFPAKPILPAYDETCLAENIIALICRNIADGGTGLTEAVYNAIVARELETRRSSQDREYRNALDGVGTTGFNLASGHLKLPISVDFECLKLWIYPSSKRETPRGTERV